MRIKNGPHSGGFNSQSLATHIANAIIYIAEEINWCVKSFTYQKESTEATHVSRIGGNPLKQEKSHVLNTSNWNHEDLTYQKWLAETIKVSRINGD